MGTVTGYTAERMKEIEDASVVNGDINSSGHLILTRFDESIIDAGVILTSPKIVTSTTRPTGVDLFPGLTIYETDTFRSMIWTGSAWVYMSGRAPSTRLKHTGTQGLTTGVLTPISFGAGSEVYNIENLHSTTVNPTRITIPAGFDGLWDFGGGLQFDTNANNTRGIIICKNGDQTTTGRLVQHEIPAAAFPLTMHVTSEARFVAGDYIELFAFQNSTVTINARGDLALPMFFWASYRGV